jgi:hypothetical protein
MQTFFYSPLEQFEIIPLIPLYFGILDFSITNETIILGIIFLLLLILFITSTDNNLSFFLVPKN